jgi:hypothetical protein
VVAAATIKVAAAAAVVTGVTETVEAAAAVEVVIVSMNIDFNCFIILFKSRICGIFLFYI